MKKTMYKYTLQILEKVSFNEQLFRKELLKAMKKLLPSEVEMLKIWAISYIQKNPHLAPSLQLIEN